MSEYLNTYNYFYNKTLKKSETFFLAALKGCFKKEIEFNFFENGTYKRITNYKSYISKNITANYSNSLSIFNNRASYFKTNELKNIFEDILKTEFIKESKKSKLKNYSYRKFICDIAILESLRNISSILQVNSKLHSKMYTLNKFNGFKLVNYQSDPDLSKIDKKLYEELYGAEESFLFTALADNEFNVTEATNRTILEKPKNKKSNTISKDLQQLNDDIEFFNDEDKIILLNICYNNINIIPITEFAKINYLTKGLYNDDFLLTKNVANSTFYKKLNNGIDYFTSKNIKKEKLNDLIRKIENLEKLNLVNTINILRKTLIRL